MDPYYQHLDEEDDWDDRTLPALRVGRTDEYEDRTGSYGNSHQENEPPYTSEDNANGAYPPYEGSGAYTQHFAPIPPVSAMRPSFEMDDSLRYNGYEPQPAYELPQRPLVPAKYEWEDVESQTSRQEPPPLLNIFGMPIGSQSQEYAEMDDDLDNMDPIYISGDEYAINTYDQDTAAEGNVPEVQLFRGNLVLDCPVSKLLLEQYPEHSPVREFTHMRYTAATCDPSAFVLEDYTLRQMCYATPRRTEIFVIITVYNENDVLLARTLQGVFNNIRHLCNRTRSDTWGQDAWKKVVVCVVADGRGKLNPRSRALMAALGVYQEGLAKNLVNDKEVQAHIYEYTSMVRIAKVTEENVRLTCEKAIPVQIMFCLKEKNAKKINSHRWALQAFAPLLQPEVCVLLDAGTRPGNRAIYHLWKSFDRDPQIGGACGEIAAMTGRFGSKLLNPVVATQNFEYKMSNILDKPTESVFGFITVLPGAFSAYRYAALADSPLEKYFKGEKLDGKGGVFQANMYLAEDRILCWELVAKRNCKWLLKYVKSAKAHTDVPEKMSDLIMQRRRWLNGSFFAQVYSLAHMWNIWGSAHSIGRKLFLHLEFFYQAFVLLYSWFNIANFFLVFHILTASLGDDSVGFAPGKVLGVVLTWVYAACILLTFILSFGNRPKGARYLFDFIVTIYALIMAYILFAVIFISVKSIEYSICANGGFEAKLLVTNSTFRDIIISLLATYVLYILASLIFLDPWHMLTSFLQYTLLSPSYINVFNVYAFCNTHDISWGTRSEGPKADLGAVKANESGKVEVELPTSTELVDKYYLTEVERLSEPLEVNESAPPSPDEKRKDYYEMVRSLVVIAWILSNLALIGVILNVGGFQTLIGDSTENSDSSSSSSSQTETKRAASGSCQEIVSDSSKTSQIYMAVVLWSMCAMAAYRFIFSTSYFIMWLFRR